jgi:IS605 OrfB family transposase
MPVRPTASAAWLTMSRLNASCVAFAMSALCVMSVVASRICHPLRSRGSGAGVTMSSAVSRAVRSQVSTASAMSRPTGRGLSLEELKGIRTRVRLRKPVGVPPTPLRQWGRVALHSWAFAQLGDFIVYKARRAGVPVVFVDPAYTSQTCCECGHVDKRNRVDQGLFICRGCGVVAHADRNASHVIGHRGEIVWNAGRESRVPAAP